MVTLTFDPFLVYLWTFGTLGYLGIGLMLTGGALGDYLKVLTRKHNKAIWGLVYLTWPLLIPFSVLWVVGYLVSRTTQE